MADSIKYNFRWNEWVYDKSARVYKASDAIPNIPVTALPSIYTSFATECPSSKSGCKYLFKISN